jgi:hypothetical protein
MRRTLRLSALGEPFSDGMRLGTLGELSSEGMRRTLRLGAALGELFGVDGMRRTFRMGWCMTVFMFYSAVILRLMILRAVRAHACPLVCTERLYVSRNLEGESNAK